MKIRECPFCGETDVATIVESFCEHQVIRFIHCNNVSCGAVVSFRFVENDNVVDSYNTRASDVKIKMVNANGR